jgi:hypothetical protein
MIQINLQDNRIGSKAKDLMNLLPSNPQMKIIL